MRIIPSPHPATRYSVIPAESDGTDRGLGSEDDRRRAEISKIPQPGRAVVPADRLADGHEPSAIQADRHLMDLGMMPSQYGLRSIQMIPFPDAGGIIPPASVLSDRRAQASFSLPPVLTWGRGSQRPHDLQTRLGT
jgi:hypothetical protein